MIEIRECGSKTRKVIEPMLQIQSGVRKVRNHSYPRELHEIDLWTYARSRTTDYAVDVYDIHGTTELTSQ